MFAVINEGDVTDAGWDTPGNGGACVRVRVCVCVCVLSCVLEYMKKTDGKGRKDSKKE